MHKTINSSLYNFGTIHFFLHLSYVLFQLQSVVSWEMGNKLLQTKCIREIKKTWKACRYSLSGMNGVLRSVICSVTCLFHSSHQNQRHFFESEEFMP